MTDDLMTRESPEAGTRKTIPAGLLSLLAALALTGVSVFVWTAISAPQEAWRIFLVNFLLCSGVVSGAVALAAILEVSDARWQRIVRPAAESCAAALPAVLALFLISALGREVLFPWAADGSGVHKPWLNVGAIYLRGSLGLLILAAVGMAFARSSRSGTGSGAGSGTGSGNAAATRWLAIAYLIVFVLVSAMLAVDLLMALDPHWYSSLFGGYYFAGNLYLGVAVATALAIAARRWLGSSDRMSREFQDRARSNMGKMLFSFSMIWMYMVWSQLLPIWYGNLPQETGYVQLRLATQPWQTLSYIVLLLNFVLPFVLLLPKAAKLNQQLLLGVALMVIAGTWIERFVLASPELMSGNESVFGMRAIFITVGFSAGFLLLLLTSLRRVSILEMDSGSEAASGSE